MNANEKEHLLLRHLDGNLSPSEHADAEQILEIDADAQRFAEAYEHLEQAVSLQPEYHPTRDLVGPAVAEVTGQAAGHHHRRSIAWLVPAFAGIVIAGLLTLQHLQPGSEKNPGLESTTEASVREARPVFTISSRKFDTVSRIRETRERLKNRKPIFDS